MIARLALVVAFSLTTLCSAAIPLKLERPDGKPGDTSRPIKVYVLAGQSNMVGMGDLKGARPPYPSIFLSADPVVIEGRMHVGTSRSRGACTWFWRNVPALQSHGVYQGATGDAKGARVDIYHGAYDPKLLSEHAKQTTMKLGQVAETVPVIDGPCTPVAKAFIDVPDHRQLLVHVGYGDSSHAIATVGGKEVYRKEPGGQAKLTKVTLEAGKRHALQITYLKEGSAALWLEQVDLVGKGDLVTLTKKGRQVSLPARRQGRVERPPGCVLHEGASVNARAAS
jgi:hypothetical protein